jgi:hypothetical protein
MVGRDTGRGLGKGPDMNTPPLPRPPANWLRPVLGLALATALLPLLAADGPSETSSGLRFHPDAAGGFRFDTGVLRGRLRPEGQSLGLTEITEVGTGARLDRSNGLLSHYRVFANGRRFGGGAWDWPSTATALDDGGVSVRWAAAPDRPFEVQAVYRFTRPDSIAVQTTVLARAELRGFEVFLASYFDPAFTNALVAARTENGMEMLAAIPARGEWQLYPRDAAARALAADGRWQLEPHPVAWTFPAELAGPRVRAQRRAPVSGLVATLTADTNDCFAVALPQQTEGHYSLYLSLFGRTLAPDETARTTATLTIGRPR